MKRRIEIRFDCDGEQQIVSFPDIESARAYAAGLTAKGWIWESFSVVRFDFEDCPSDAPAVVSVGAAV